ncbi:stage II sporulation protein D [Dethiothermospora halolimnae]|uniref:stage II sporulation protein D n=1 Tax=Dethiothermospora halolimnae TaxID=3114390 RepID=UPI003CCBCE42
MKRITIGAAFILFITVIIPMVLILGYDIFINEEENQVKVKEEENITEDYEIDIYNIKTKKVEKVKMEEYLKGVVAAEMPAAFHIEALKAQAVAARTYSMNKIKTFKDGHPDHPQTALCTGIHCQAWLSKEDLKNIKGEDWIKNYWPKIEEAVDKTKGEVAKYNGKIIEAFFHSNSGGMTENSEDVFSAARPYLKRVESPYDEDSPKYKNEVTISIDQFISKIKANYPKVNLDKNNFHEKIKSVSKTESGRVKELMIDGEVVSGRDIRSIFKLNSTNFVMHANLEENIIKIQTKGNGHGVGLSQWGANGMAKAGNDYIEILKHYYTGVDIEKAY